MAALNALPEPRVGAEAPIKLATAWRDVWGRTAATLALGGVVNLLGLQRRNTWRALYQTRR